MNRFARQWRSCGAVVAVLAFAVPAGVAAVGGAASWVTGPERTSHPPIVNGVDVAASPSTLAFITAGAASAIRPSHLAPSTRATGVVGLRTQVRLLRGVARRTS